MAGLPGVEGVQVPVIKYYLHNLKICIFLFSL